METEIEIEIESEIEIETEIVLDELDMSDVRLFCVWGNRSIPCSGSVFELGLQWDP